MESAIQKLAIVTFFVIGLSHIVQPRVWAQLFINIREKGATGSFIIAFIHFPLGALIVAFHDVWQGLPMILTFIGYSLVLKSLVYFVFPQRGLKFLSRVSIEKSWEFVAAGIISVGLSGLLAFIHITIISAGVRLLGQKPLDILQRLSDYVFYNRRCNPNSSSPLPDVYLDCLS